MEKLRIRLKTNLKVWKREVFGLVDLNIEKIVADTNSIKAADKDQHDTQVDPLRADKEILALVRKKDIFWMKKTVIKTSKLVFKGVHGSITLFLGGL